jgi:hypothetical protein
VTHVQNVETPIGKDHFLSRKKCGQFVKAPQLHASTPHMHRICTGRSILHHHDAEGAIGRPRRRERFVFPDD